MTTRPLFGIPVVINPAMPDDMVLMIATCARCGHATALHVGSFGCSECLDWPEDLRCKGDAIEGGTSIVMVRDIDALTTAAQQRERSELLEANE